MKRFRVAVAAIVVLAGALFAAPVHVAAAVHTYSCTNLTPQNLLTGRFPNTSDNETGVSAAWDPEDYGPCGPADPLGDAGFVTWWVALVPGPTNPYYGHQDAIVQVGVFDCTDWRCKTNGPEFIWAFGGCNGYLPGPLGLSGATGLGAHTFKVDFFYGPPQSWNVYIDGVNRVHTQAGDGSSMWAGTSCWIGGDRNVAISAEKGDQSDDYGTNGLVVTGMQRRVNNSWLNFTGVGACELVNTQDPHHDGCGANGTTMSIWTNF